MQGKKQGSKYIETDAEAFDTRRNNTRHGFVNETDAQGERGRKKTTFTGLCGVKSLEAGESERVRERAQRNGDSAGKLKLTLE